MNFDGIYNKFCNAPEMQKFITDINSVGRGFKRQKNNPSNLCNLSTLVSFNFYKEKLVNFKVYCEIFRHFNDKEIVSFLPTPEHFKHYINFWDSNRDSSLCYALKLDRKYNPTQYFHIKLNKFLHEFYECEMLFKNKINFTSVGVSYEYSHDKAKKKLYYYITEESEIIKIFSLFNLTVPVQWVDHIEFTYLGNNEIKVIVIYKFRINKCIVGLKENNLYTGIKKKAVDFFYDKFFIYPSYFGKYDKDICSLYWSATETPIKLGDTYIDNKAYFSKNYLSRLNCAA
jgi:hypothetical protein